MAKSRYLWIPGDKAPPIAKHSQAKHEVLSAYIARYVEVLTANPRQEHLRITLIDGFAGGGLYTDESTKSEVLGSPLLMLEAIREAEAIARTRRKKDFHIDAQFIFIERRRATAAYLESAIKDRTDGRRIGESVHILVGEFADHIDPVLKLVQRAGRNHRAPFFLDQYGYADVPFEILRRLFLHLPHAEVILTFATEWLIDYLADTPESNQVQRKLGLTLPFPSIDALKQSSTDWKRIIQLELHEQIHRASGASFCTPFFIRSVEAHRSYWLIHLSGHARARDVMASLHWEKHNYFEHYGRAGLKMLGYNPRRDYESQGFRVFDFDAEARVMTVEALAIELPNRIPKSPQKISFADLFSSITNETPATEAIVKEVIQKLSLEREILVYDENDRVRERGVAVAAKDRIFRPKEKQLRM